MTCLRVLARICLSSTALIIAAEMADQPRSAAAASAPTQDVFALEVGFSKSALLPRSLLWAGPFS